MSFQSLTPCGGCGYVDYCACETGERGGGVVTFQGKFIAELRDAVVVARGTGEKVYVSKNGEIAMTYMPHDQIMYEVYPGGRIVGWGCVPVERAGEVECGINES